MNEIASFVEKFKTVLVIPLLVGISLTAWAGLKLIDEHQKYSEALVKYKREVLGSDILFQLLEHDVNLLVSRQQTSVGFEEGGKWADHFKKDFKKRLETLLESSKAKSDFENTRDNTPWLLYAILTSIGALVAVVCWILMYWSEREDTARHAEAFRKEEQRKDRVEQDAIKKQERIDAARAQAENRSNP